jgi:outer membrane protein assembly factor BamE
MKHIRISLIAALILTLGGCSWFEGYRPPVQQGNAVGSQALSQLKIGMSESQVRFIMGEPMLVDPFNPNRWDYTYYDQPSFGKTTTKHLTLYFANKHLVRIVNNDAKAKAKAKPQ